HRDRARIVQRVRERELRTIRRPARRKIDVLGDPVRRIVPAPDVEIVALALVARVVHEVRECGPVVRPGKGVPARDEQRAPSAGAQEPDSPAGDERDRAVIGSEPGALLAVACPRQATWMPSMTRHAPKVAATRVHDAFPVGRPLWTIVAE